MGGAFLITLREGLEAGLIVAIVLAYLKATGHISYFRTVWLGTVAAVGVSLIVGAGIFAAAGEFEGRAAVAFEGVAMLSAVAVLTWMIIWMKRQAVHIRRQLEQQVSVAVTTGSLMALALIPFTAVLREGLETAVFLFAASRTATPLDSTVGALAGLFFAGTLSYGVYSGGYRLNLRLFFNLTGVLLIFFAAGLLAHGIHELQAAKLAPVGVEHVWDIGGVLPDGEGVGEWFKGILGYNANPSLAEVIAYPAYVVVALWYFLALRPPVPQPVMRPAPEPAPEPFSAD
ncbi:MAG: FTR1 family protein [Chloroflexi bacterium]|nr:FTR1 family protein [Chloroflexota bacterium]